MEPKPVRQTNLPLMILGLLVGAYLSLFVLIILDFRLGYCWLEKNASRYWLRQLERAYAPIILLVKVTKTKKLITGSAPPPC